MPWVQGLGFIGFRNFRAFGASDSDAPAITPPVESSKDPNDKAPRAAVCEAFIVSVAFLEKSGTRGPNMSSQIGQELAHLELEPQTMQPPQD